MCFCNLLILITFSLISTDVSASTWETQLIDTSGPGKFSSLKIDDHGNAHVAYVVDDGKNYPLKYAFWDHAIKKWFVMTVSDGSGPCSLALDSKQRPHISYVDFGTASGSKLRYAHWDGLSWKTQAIPLSSDVIAYYNSIALDSADRPSISFYEYRGPRDTEIRIRMRIVNWSGQSWQVRTVDGQEGSGKFNSLAADASGGLHLAYANVSVGSAGMRYARWNGSAWSPEIVDGPENNGGASVGYSAFLALDKEGNPHISYMNETTPTVKYATRKPGKGNEWQVQIIERVAGVAYPDRNSVAVDEEGNPYIGYYDGGRGLFKVAHRQGPRWHIEILDSNASGFTSSLQIYKGVIWVTYADESSGGLKVARRPLADVSTDAHLQEPGPKDLKMPSTK